MLLSLHFSFGLIILLISTEDMVLCSNGLHHQIKRQIFREQVVPYTGGKIPEDAFRSDRLVLNRLNKEGITLPDGITITGRRQESHYNTLRFDPDISGSTLKLILKPDGRYAPPEGNYPFDNLVESTYVIRPPISSKHYIRLPPFKAIEVPLRLPAEPFFPSDEDILSLTNHVDHFYNLNHLEGSRAWPTFSPFFHGRILREAMPNIRQPSKSTNNLINQIPANTKVQTPAVTQAPTPKPSAVQKRPSAPTQHQPPQLTSIPSTTFKCTTTSPRMVADPETGCQVFHLCHMDGQKESFLCPKGMRFNSTKSQCLHWEQVPCHMR